MKPSGAAGSRLIWAAYLIIGWAHIRAAIKTLPEATDRSIAGPGSVCELHVHALYDFRGGVSITEIRDLPPLGVIRRRPQAVPAAGDCLHPFGFLPQRDAGHAVEICLFLQAPGICQDNAGMMKELAHAEITQGLNH